MYKSDAKTSPAEAEKIGFAKTHDEFIIDFEPPALNQIKQYIILVL